MKRYRHLLIAATFVMASGIGFAQQSFYDDDTVSFSQRDMSGPRLGYTFIPPNTPFGKLAAVKNLGVGVSQFGWHFESAIIPAGHGPAFSVQFIPLLTGVESGHFILSSTLAFGIRLPNGFEFGMGPNLMMGDLGSASSLVIAVGKSFSYGGVSLPVDLTFSTSPSGYRVGMLFGYAIHRGASR
jgi:hypothetical protein